MQHTCMCIEGEVTMSCLLLRVWYRCSRGPWQCSEGVLEPLLPFSPVPYSIPPPHKASPVVCTHTMNTSNYGYLNVCIFEHVSVIEYSLCEMNPRCWQFSFKSRSKWTEINLKPWRADQSKAWCFHYSAYCWIICSATAATQANICEMRHLGVFFSTRDDGVINVFIYESKQTKCRPIRRCFQRETLICLVLGPTHHSGINLIYCSLFIYMQCIILEVRWPWLNVGEG